MDRFPSIKAVAHDLAVEQKALRRMFNRSDLVDPYDAGNDWSGVDVRLQVGPEYAYGQTFAWAIRAGDASYDTDHRGYWGAGSLPYGRCNLRELAKDLLQDARSDYYQQIEIDGRDR